METSPVPLPRTSIERSIEKPGISLWSVHLHVVGHFWWPQWEGFATDSMDASSRARRWFYGNLYREVEIRERYPLRILSVVPVGV